MKEYVRQLGRQCNENLSNSQCVLDQPYMARVNASCLALLLSCCLLSAGAAEAAAVHDVAGFGAKPDGRTDSSAAFADAWCAACRSPEPATVYVPRGEFLLSHAAFAGPCSSRVTVQIDGTLVAPSGYTSRGGSGDDVWIVFDRVDGLTVSGSTLDGRGAALWACKAAGHGGCPSGATVSGCATKITCSKLLIYTAVYVRARVSCAWRSR
jgi:polygalacturonase